VIKIVQRDNKGRFIKGNIPDSKKDIDDDEVIRLYKSGMTLEELSKRFGYKDISCRIFKLINKLGISRPAGFQEGTNHWNWKDGFKKSNGYVVFRNRNKYEYYHSYVWCVNNDMLTVPIGCVVHHINLKKEDNRTENLVLLPKGYHMSLHRAINGGEL